MMTLNLNEDAVDQVSVLSVLNVAPERVSVLDADAQNIKFFVKKMIGDFKSMELKLIRLEKPPDI